MNRQADISTAVILAGGANTRYPTLKGFIEIEGGTIMERNLSVLRRLFPEVMINTNLPERYFYLGAPLIGDVLPSRGPMAGIHAALLNTKGDALFVTACDMPFLDAGLVSLVCDRHRQAAEEGPVDATVPLYNGEPQPLFGVYGRSMLKVLEEGVLGDKCALKPLLASVRTRYVAEADVRALDREGRSFVNINTVEDYEAVRGRQR